MYAMISWRGRIGRALFSGRSMYYGLIAPSSNGMVDGVLVEALVMLLRNVEFGTDPSGARRRTTTWKRMGGAP